MTATTVWVDDHFIAGDVALDFANTVYRRTPELGADLFNNAEALISWLVRAQLLRRTEPPERVFANVDAALEEARRLRALLWTAFDAEDDGDTVPADAFAGLLDIARRGVGGITLDTDGSATPLTPDGVFAALAVRALRLVLSPPSQGVRSCDRCGWFFVDYSRGRRRRWCSMKTCGNQAKAARYRSTHP